MKHSLYLLLFFTTNLFYSQTVSVNSSNLGCRNTGIVTTSTTGITTPTFQLQLSDGTVIAPVAGNSSAFANNNVFNALSNGVYKVIAKDNVGTLFSSNNITVSDGYTNMVLINNPVTLRCIGDTRPVPISITGGKAPFVYVISNSSTNEVIQTSASINPRTFTFNALPLGSYSVSVTDACGVVVPGTILVNNPTVTVDQLGAGFNLQGYPENCGRARVFTPVGFTKSGVQLTASERALFTYKFKFNGEYYGVDTSGDGFPDLNTNGIALGGFILQNLPIQVTRNDYYNPATRPTIVAFDNCGNSKEFSLILSKDAFQISVDCINGGAIRISLQASLLCVPINYTFTNTTNPAEVFNITQTANGQSFTGFTLGATYNVAYVDGNGNTSSVNYGFSNTTFTIPSSLIINTTASVEKNPDYENFAGVKLSVSNLLYGNPYSFEVTSSNNASIPVGYSGSTTQGGYLTSPVTTPANNWPNGTYTLKIITSCGNSSVTFTVNGFTTPIITGNTLSPICGGFNYVMTGTFNSFSNYKVDIIAGPSNVGLSRSLVSSSASDVFPNLAYGTYTAGVRTNSGTRYMATQTFSYGANGVITVDKTETGGFVCNSGENNGVLAIVASTLSPAPNNVLEYRLSLDGGTTYGAWQTNNTFSGLTDTVYTFQVKDGCGSIITDNSEIGAISSPQVSANYEIICELQTDVVLTLQVNTANAIYSWSGPGINATNQTQRNPVINLNDLSIGVNEYSVTVTSTFCPNSATETTTITKLSSTRPSASTGVALDSKALISTQKKSDYLDKINNGALVLESSNKGFVITRLSTAQLPSGSNAIKGMLVYDKDVNCLKMYNGVIWKCIGKVCPQ